MAVEAATAEPAAELERLWSVTTLIGEGLPKEALKWWARNVTAEFAVDNIRAVRAMMVDEQGSPIPGGRDTAVGFVKSGLTKVRGAAAFRGSQLHKAQERLAYGEELGDDFRGIEPYVEQYQRFLDDHKPVFHMAEAAVYNRTHRYGGTLDNLVELPAWPGRLMVMDAKTSGKTRADESGKPPFPEIALQLVSYKRAEFVDPRPRPARMQTWRGRRYYVLDDYGPPLVPMPETADVGLALAVFPDDYALVPVTLDETVWQSFLDVYAVAQWQLVTSRTVLGQPLDPWNPEEGQ
jgi:hypothetical protein